LIKELDSRLVLLEGKKNLKETLKSASVESDTTVTTLLDNQPNKSIPVTTGIDNSNNLTNSFLYQNCPNPYSEQTEIKYYISEGVKTSSLDIFDMQGILKKQINLNTYGFGSVIIKATELKAGMYMYSLVCDNQEISTKRMILTE